MLDVLFLFFLNRCGCNQQSLMWKNTGWQEAYEEKGNGSFPSCRTEEAAV